MERLTKKEGVITQIDKDGNITKNDFIEVIGKDEAYKKLCQIEDIEEEIGVGLICSVMLCKKANNQKYVYIKESHGASKLTFLDNLDIELFNHRLYVNSRGTWVSLDLKDYGIEWALTESELEDEN